MVNSNLKLDSSTLQYFCHLLESDLARINWIRAVDKFCVEQFISCQKCRPIDCRAIKFRAVHPHSINLFKLYYTRWEYPCLAWVDQPAPPPPAPLPHQPAHLNLRGLVFNFIKKIALAALSFFCC